MSKAQELSSDIMHKTLSKATETYNSDIGVNPLSGGNSTAGTANTTQTIYQTMRQRKHMKQKSTASVISGKSNQENINSMIISTNKGKSSA